MFSPRWKVSARWKHSLGATIVAAALTWCSSLAYGAAPANEPELPEPWGGLHQMIRPQPGETPWLDGGIDWKINLAEAQQQAAREGKPILIWHVIGAGYRDGLGRC